MLYDPKWQVKAEPWREVLLKAADLIEKHGLSKRCLERPDGSLCIMGAINMAMYGKSFVINDDPVRAKAIDRMDDFCGATFIQFNNARHTTKDDIVAKMRECAAAE